VNHCADEDPARKGSHPTDSAKIGSMTVPIDSSLDAIARDDDEVIG